MIRILIINHYPLKRDLYRIYLSGMADFEVVGTSKGKPDFMEQIRALAPDIIISGLYFGGNDYNGLNIIEEIRRRYADIKILIISSYFSEKLLNTFREYQNISFCHKSITVDELSTVISAIHRGDTVVKYSHDGSFKNTSNLILGDDTTVLSTKRTEILRKLAKGSTTKEIAQQLNLSETTIIDHIRSMREKLGAKNQCELIAIAFRKGLIG